MLRRFAARAQALRAWLSAVAAALDPESGESPLCAPAAAQPASPSHPEGALRARMRIAGTARVLLAPLLPEPVVLGGHLVSVWPYGIPVDQERPAEAPFLPAATLLARLHAGCRRSRVCPGRAKSGYHGVAGQGRRRASAGRCGPCPGAGGGGAAASAVIRAEEEGRGLDEEEDAFVEACLRMAVGASCGAR